MKTKVYCKTQEKGVHTFYLNQGGEVYYLFSQDYRKGVSKYYGCPISLDEAIDCSRAKRDSAILRTMEKITASVRYLEKQYNIAIYKKSAKKLRTPADRRACA
jgi:hypothetical protein